MKLRSDIKQRHLEKFEQLAFGDDDPTTAGLSRGHIVRAAVESGWFGDDAGDVGDMTPADVRKAWEAVTEAYKAMIAIDPN